MEMKEKQFYTVTEVCSLLSIHPNTLRRADKAGKIVCGRTPGGRRRISAAQLALLIEMFAPTAPQPASEATP
jgi:excisionase family DNA binding protein